MNPFGKTVKDFFIARNYKYKEGSFSKWFPDYGLLAEVSFSPVRNVFEKVIYGYQICIHAYYPRKIDFFGVSPFEFRCLRKDGTARDVGFVTETAGIYAKEEGALVLAVLEGWFDFWEEKLVTPNYALEIFRGLRGTAPFPDYLSYINKYVAANDHDKIRFAMQQEACVCPFEGGGNLTSYLAYLNAGGLFSEAEGLITDADAGLLYKNSKLSSTSDNTLGKLKEDAISKRIHLSDSNIQRLIELGHL